jgi:plasmid stabilization system protein ParE
MVYEIVWSELALQSYLSNINYLQTDWTETEILKFTNATNEILKLLSLQPAIGRATSKRAFLRKLLVSKRIILIYRFNPANNLVELVQFFNTWQHPNKRKDAK